MTKEEYEGLLKSDYWKGYSYSIIKERNFTCEDCGRQFLNERNKLQVHHLVYRDVKPWSYKPEELIVLCEDCHRKRHGIISPAPQNKSATNGNIGYPSGNYDKGGYKSDGIIAPIRKWIKRKNLGRIFVYAFIAVFAYLMLAIIYVCSYRKPKTEGLSNVNEYRPSNSTSTIKNGKSSTTSKETPKEVSQNDSTAEFVEERSSELIELLPSIPQVEQQDVEPKENEVTTPTPQTESKDKPTKELSTLELLERKNHEDVVKQAKRAGVSTEGSTIEILERINRKDLERFGY